MRILMMSLAFFQDLKQQDEMKVGQADRRQDGTCDGKCGEDRMFTADIGVCKRCGNGTESGGIPVCQACAQKDQVCRYCNRPLKGSKPDEIGKIQKELDSSLPGHKAGREFSTEQIRSAFKGLKVFMVLHAPCKTCAKSLEPLAIVVKDQVKIIREEKDLEAVLREQKTHAKPDETAWAAAQLVQAMWEPGQGGLEKKSDRVFEYKKGRALWKLAVTFDKDGAVERLLVEDTGRESK